MIISIVVILSDVVSVGLTMQQAAFDSYSWRAPEAQVRGYLGLLGDNRGGVALSLLPQVPQDSANRIRESSGI
jgi:CheY-specific phosphatase CheX